MSKLRVTEEVGLVFVGGLLSIIRTDDEIGPKESMALQRVLAECLEQQVDIADAMFTHVTPTKMAQALSKLGGSYRDQAMSSAQEVATAFVAAAREIADSADGLGAREVNLINRYAQALNVPGIDL